MCNVAQADLKFRILLPQPLVYCGSRAHVITRGKKHSLLNLCHSMEVIGLAQRSRTNKLLNQMTSRKGLLPPGKATGTAFLHSGLLLPKEAPGPEGCEKELKPPSSLAGGLAQPKLLAFEMLPLYRGQQCPQSPPRRKQKRGEAGKEGFPSLDSGYFGLF